MKKKDGIFYGKILLFGEYSVMCDSMALTVPYTHFQGELSFFNEDKYTNQAFATESNKVLKEFYQHLQSLNSKAELLASLDLNRLNNDLNHGMYFESSIPQGFGVGSSGALVAAIYEKYASPVSENPENLTVENLQRLKKIFSQMESWFHGVSSGLDPLNCFLRQPLLIKPNAHIQPVGIPREFAKDGGIFLINTGKPGKTGPLVSLFFEKCKEDGFRNLVKSEMILYNNNSINAIIQAEFGRFFQNLKLLSGFLFTHFRPMIPESYVSLWQQGLDTGDFYLKLCGSGGGGFLLGFTENLENTRQILQSKNVEIIPVSRF